MPTDVYTKTILTVIAICLVWLCVRGQAVVPLSAQVNRGDEVVKVQIVSIDEARGLRWEPLPVTVR